MRCSSRLLLISLAAIAACARGVRVQTDDVTVPDDVTSPSAPISTRVLGDIARRVLGFVPWRFVAAFVDDDKVRIWRGSNRPSLVLRRCPVHDVRDVKFLPWGRRIVVAGPDGVAWICDAYSDRKLHVLKGAHRRSSTIFEVQVFSDGRRVATLGSDSRLAIWSVDSGEALRVLSLARFGQHQVLRVTAADRLVTGVGGASAVVWCPASGQPVHVLAHRHLRFLEVSPCGRRAITADGDRAFVWDLMDGKVQQSLRLPLGEEPMRQVAVTGRRRGIAAAAAAGLRLYIWEGSEEFPVRAMLTSSTDCLFSLIKGAEVAITVSNFVPSAWNTSTGELLWRIPFRDAGGFWYDPVGQIVTSAGGELVAACGGERHHHMKWLRVINTSTGHQVHSASRFGLGNHHVSFAYESSVADALPHGCT